MQALQTQIQSSTSRHRNDSPLRRPQVWRPSGKRCEEVMELCEAMIDLTAALFSVSSKEMRKAGRASSQVARVRQIAMYVSHVVLGLSMVEVGKGFQRERTTVLHACHLVEDMRDDEEFDRVVAKAERVAMAAFRYCTAV